MTIQQMMQQLNVEFWGTVPMSLLCTIAEFMCTLCFAHGTGICLKGRRERIASAVLLVLFGILQFQHLPVVLQCLLMLLLCTGYLYLLQQYSWHHAVFESSYFCLLLEVGKSLSRDGFAALVIKNRLELSDRALYGILLGIYLLYLCLLGVYLYRRRRMVQDIPLSATQVTGLLFPLLLYLAVRTLQYNRTEQLDASAWLLYDALQYAVAVCAIIVLHVTEMLLASQAEKIELRRQQTLMEQRLTQYRQSRDSIRYINQHYHDLKHYMTALQTLLTVDPAPASHENAQEIRDLFGLIEKEIAPYGSMQHTGNEVLDVLLTQRMQECLSKGIRLIPYVDGTDADQMSVIDLCTLFGNAMDNAVEAADAVRDEEKREIRVRIGTADRFFLMRFQNYYEGERVREEDRFITTKQDEAEHGYGLGSISAIAEKYGGTVTSECTREEFILYVMIPLAAEISQR